MQPLVPRLRVPGEESARGPRGEPQRHRARPRLPVHLPAIEGHRVLPPQGRHPSGHQAREPADPPQVSGPLEASHHLAFISLFKPTH